MAVAVAVSRVAAVGTRSGWRVARSAFTTLRTGDVRLFSQAKNEYKLVPDIRIPESSVASVAKELSKGESNVRYIDCRSEEEQATGIVPGSVNLPFPHNGDNETIDPDEWLEDVAYEDFELDTRIFVGCKKGHRSAMACELLIKAGYTNVTNVRGGLVAWSQADLPMTSYGG